jgi:hypothetical protein
MSVKNSIDSYYKYHGSDVWSTERYEIRKKNGGVVYKSSYIEACRYIIKNINLVVPYKKWEEEKERHFSSLFCR